MSHYKWFVSRNIAVEPTGLDYSPNDPFDSPLSRKHTELNKELENALGMSRTAGTQTDEIETLFALSEAYTRSKDLRAAARNLHSIITRYGRNEYLIPPVMNRTPAEITKACSQVTNSMETRLGNAFFQKEITRGLALTRKSLPIYFSALSPLAKTCTVRAGKRAVSRLAAILETDKDLLIRFLNMDIDMCSFFAVFYGVVQKVDKRLL